MSELIQDAPTPASRIDAAPARSDPYAGRPGRQWYLIIVLTLLMTMGYIDRQIMTLLANPIKASLHVTDTQFSLVFGLAFVITNAVFAVPAGYLADRISRRGMIATGAVVWSVLCVSCGAATNYLQLFLGRAGVGFGEAVIGPCSMSMVRSSVEPERRGRAFAILGMAGMGGSALALIVGGLLLKAVIASGVRELPIVGAVEPWQIVLILVGLVGLPLSALMMTVREPLAERFKLDAAAQAKAGTTYGQAFAYMGGRWRVYVPLIVFQTVSGASAMAFGAWIATTMVRSYHVSIPQVGMTLGLIMLIVPQVGLLAIGGLLDWFAKKGGLVGACTIGFFLAIGFCLSGSIAPFAPTLPLFLSMIALHMFFSGTNQSTGNTLLANVTPENMMGKVAGMQLFIYGVLAAALAPLSVALLSDTVYKSIGERSLAYALGTMVFTFSMTAIVSIVLVRIALKREERLGE